MAKRFPFRVAIAGLTAVAVATAPVTTPNTAVLSAAVAQAQTGVAVTGDKVIKLNETATFTATVPNATDGSVQFYLDGVAQGAAVEISQGKATSAPITAVSYATDKFPHTVTARYIDANNLNPVEDGTATFTTPVRDKTAVDKDGYNAADAAIYGKGEIFTSSEAAKSYSIDAPLELEENEYTARGYMNFNETGRLYEIGINPPKGSNYVNGTARNVADSSWRVVTLADANGVAVPQFVEKGLNPSEWGKKPKWSNYQFPNVNPGYVGIQVGKGGTYSVATTRDYTVEATFTKPDAPGIYVPEFATYKHDRGLHVLVPMEGAAFRVAPETIPPRKTEDASSEQPENPTDPNQPGDGDTTTDPNQPGGDTTTDPNQPGGDTTTDPNQPGDGDTTTDPNQPGDGDTPTDPSQPGGDDTTTDPNQPGDDTTTDPNQPGDGNTPTDPNQPGGDDTTTDPNQPGDGNTPTDPNQPGGDDTTTDPNQPGDGDTTTDPNQPGGDDNQSEPVKPQALNVPVSAVKAGATVPLIFKVAPNQKFNVYVDGVKVGENITADDKGEAQFSVKAGVKAGVKNSIVQIALVEGNVEGEKIDVAEIKVESDQNVPAGRVVYDKAPALNQETTFTAHVKAGTKGKVRFIIKDNQGNEILAEDKRDVEINNDKAEVKVTFAKAGTYSIETQIVPADGEDPYENTTSATFNVEVTNGTAPKAPLTDACKKQIGIGVGIGLTGLIIAGLSQMRIPNLQQKIIDLQKQMGIFNPQLAAAAERAVPVAGGLIGLVLTGLSIGNTIDKCVPGAGSSRQSETGEGQTA